MIKKQKGFVMVFVIAVVAALSIMTGAMFFYYDNDLKSVSRNSVMQQVTLAAETGLQEGQRWIADQLNTNTFNLVDIQNSLKIEESNNACLNRHGYTNVNQDVYFARRIQANLGNEDVYDAKFEDVSYEVFIQRQADIVGSIYFSANGSKNNEEKDTNYNDRSFALVRNFNDFPTKQFTIEFWINNKQPTSVYDTHLFEFGRTGDAVFRVKNDKWTPTLGYKRVGRNAGVGAPIKNEWVHIAWVWDGGDPAITDTNNVRIYQDGVLAGTYDADVLKKEVHKYQNSPESLPEGNYWPLAIGEGLAGFKPANYKTGKVKIKSVPWLGNIAEMRIWNISRSADDIKNNRRKRLTGSEPGLVSYYKFNEGTGKIAKDSNTSRPSSKSNDATIYGLGTVGTSWQANKEYYPLTVPKDNDAPTINFPPGDDLVFYKVLSCGTGPQGQIIPLELIVTAPVQQGDIGDGKIALTTQDLKTITLADSTHSKISLGNYVANNDVAGDISIQKTGIYNTDFYPFKPSMEQCKNKGLYAQFNQSTAYNEEDCAEFEDKLWILEKDTGTDSGDAFDEADWVEVLGSRCDGVKFSSSSGDDSYGHYYKYFSTVPNLTEGVEIGYDKNSISWWEAKRRAEQSTCGGMRGYLVSIESQAENDFIKNAVMCDNSTDSGCTGVTPFHVAAGETRENYYGSRLASASDQHYIWLANSDWRVPLQNPAAMKSESGPDMGKTNSFIHWQNGEPNSSSGEHFVDMEINRVGRVNGKWNDLKVIPDCANNGRDCITGYVVEYGGFDSFKLDHDEDGDEIKDGPKDLSENTKTCIARATIEKDKYVSEEDYLKYDTEAEDANALVVPASVAPFDTDTSDEYPGWDVENGVLTLFHNDKPTSWTGNQWYKIYQPNEKIWFNNRAWKNISGSTIRAFQFDKAPTIYNPHVWHLYSGNEPDAPCGNLNFWRQAFESIQYINPLAVSPDDKTHPFGTQVEPNADGTPSADTLIQESSLNTISLGERVIIFSLGPLHVQKHPDGYNHFYEFYKFPYLADYDWWNNYNDNNRRMNEGFTLSKQLQYFAKTGYLATITSEEENNIIIEKASGNGWLGGLAQSEEQSSYGDLEKCGGIRQRTNKTGISGRIVAQKDFQAMRQIEKSRAGAIIMIDNLSSEISATNTNIPVNSTAHFPEEGAIKIGSEIITYTGKTATTFTGAVRGEDETTASSHASDAPVTETYFKFIWSWYKKGQTYSGTTTDPKYIRFIHPIFADTDLPKPIISISATDGDERTIVNVNNHGLNHDDIVFLEDIDDDDGLDADANKIINDDIDGTNLKSYYRVVKLNTSLWGYDQNQFELIDLDTRRHIDTSDINYISNSAQIRKVNGIRNEYYRTLTEITVDQDDQNRQNQNGLEMFWKDPKVILMATVNGSNNKTPNSDCPTWRWVTGPEQFLHDHKGLAFTPNRTKNENPSASQNGKNKKWTRALPIGPPGEQLGEKFKDNMPFRHWGDNQPDNALQKEAGLHMMDVHLSAEREWNDMFNWNQRSNNSFGIRGIIVEYGGLESAGDSITRVAAKRIINLYDRRVLKATVKILSGKQTGDKLLAPTTLLTKLDLKVSGNGTDTITYTGSGTCDNYLKVIRLTTFEHNGGLGAREISVKIGDVVKTVGSNYYFKKVDGGYPSYQHADYQASYSNLCGLQGYLANVTTAEDLTAIASLGVTDGKEAWINGTDRCKGGIYKSGFWRYTSGPLKDKEFWRLRINYSGLIDADSDCNETVLRPSETSLRVGPFEDSWSANHPGADDKDYLTFLSGSTPKIKTREDIPNTDVDSYIVKYGGSVGDFAKADLQENNIIQVISGPSSAELSFYEDGSQNSIFIDQEDTLKLASLSAGWTSRGYTLQSSPLIITAPVNKVTTEVDWRRELAKVYYENEDKDDFTPGNRRIQITLKYADATLNETFGIVKNIGSKNKVTVSPTSWSNR